MDSTRLHAFVENLWTGSILPALADYIRIPNKSPMFDAEWAAHGHMDRAVELAERWCRAHAPAGMSLEVVRLPGRTPLLYADIPGAAPGCVLLYGHLDKQPEMSGWRAGLGPWQPVFEGERLYGRGGADDGYAVFASLAAILGLQEQGIAHPRCVLVIECCEESGSFDLPHYIDHLASRIGTPDLVVCLDSGCGNYEQLWCTTSLRGLVGGVLSVEVLSEGVHSGDASGVVPSSFRIARQLIGRIEHAATGVIIPPAFHAPIPDERISQAEYAGEVLGDTLFQRFPFVEGAQPVNRDRAALVLNRTWRPALEVIGADGLPPPDKAGNVLRPATRLKLSLRLPPTTDAQAAGEALKSILEADPPYGARVRFDPDWGASGWHAPPLSERVGGALDRASRAHFGRPAVHMGEGGSIPFMGMLGRRFPDAQFVVTGVLGPQSNAHGPNEFLHVPTAKKLTCCVAEVIAEMGR